jgi:ATP-dependent Clp protease ATP-binding subunit ClpC
VVLFFDELHTLFSGDMADEIQGELKVALARGELPCIGATTHEEYKRAIDSDAALARRFSVVEVEEPDPGVAREIVSGCAPALAKHHGVAYADAALTSAIAWSVRYLPGRVLPDKALSILDLAGARARRRSARHVTPDGIAEVVAELADMPVERLLETDTQRMLALESLLAERVVGHGAALSRMANILRRNAAGFHGGRPIGTFLLLGPTGVGKTESAKAIAEALFHSDTAMTRLDMAEYAESHSVARLIGAPPGYIGHDAGGQLTEAVRRRPYQVILLDEIEKAHRDVLEAFLGVFDEGRLTDGRGKTVDFTNSVIILTSNLGADEIRSRGSRTIGFGSSPSARVSQIEQALVAAARAALPPELYNRIDEVIAFAPLERAEVAEIARRLLAGLAAKLRASRGVLLDVDEEAIDALLAAGGFDPELGARPMKRTLARLVEAPIADMVLRGNLSEGDVARLTVEEGQIVVDVVKGHIAPRSRPVPSTESLAPRSVSRSRRNRHASCLRTANDLYEH